MGFSGFCLGLGLGCGSVVRWLWAGIWARELRELGWFVGWFLGRRGRGTESRVGLWAGFQAREGVLCWFVGWF